MFNKAMTVAAWFYGIAFIGSTVAALGLVLYSAITGDMIDFGSH